MVSRAFLSMRYIGWIGGCLLLLFSSCEREITVDLPQGNSHIVVEGYIENGTNPYVILTKDVPYFASINLSELQDLFIKGASVKVSDGVTKLAKACGMGW